MKKVFYGIIIFFIVTVFLLALEPYIKAARTKTAIVDFFSGNGKNVDTWEGSEIARTAVTDYENGTDSLAGMDEADAEDAALSKVGLQRIVMSTYNPFGTAGDGDFRFRDVTVNTKGYEIRIVRPSDEEIASYRNRLIEECTESNEKEYKKKNKNKKKSGTVEDSKDMQTGMNASIGEAGGYLSFARLMPVTSPAEEELDYARILERRIAIDEPLIPTAVVAPTAMPTAAPTAAPTRVPSATPTPKPTATPTPVPDFSPTDEQMAQIERSVNQYISENTKEVKSDKWYSFDLSGEKLREYVNSYRAEWQVTYTMAVMVQLYYSDSDYVDVDQIQITQEVLNEVAGAINDGYDFSLYIDYWDENAWPEESWDKEKRTLSIEDDGALWGSYYDRVSGETTSMPCYTETIRDYRKEPLKSDPDLCEQWWFEPLVLFSNVTAWDEAYTYGAPEEPEKTNAYGYISQKIVGAQLSPAFLEMTSVYDFPKEDLLVMQDAIELLPEAAVAYTKWAQCLDRMAGTGGFLVDNAEITWLTGNSFGEQISRLALAQVGAIYSNKLRYEDGYFDCSSLVHYLYQSFGIDISIKGDIDGSDVAATECKWCIRNGYKILDVYNENVMQPGDIIFWETTNPKHDAYPRFMHVYHTGIYIGNGYIVDASTNNGCVVCRSMWGAEKVVAVARIAE